MSFNALDHAASLLTGGPSNAGLDRYERELLARDRAAFAAMEQQTADYAQARRLAGGVPVHGASTLKRGLLVTPCGGEWPAALKDSASRPPEATNPTGITCHLCRHSLGMPPLVTP